MANHIADIANWFFIGSLVVGVVSTILIVWMAGIKEGHWERDRQESSERIEGLQSESEKARAAIAESDAKTATANENAAKANERAAQLELALEKERAARLPRALRREQRSALINFLTPALKGRVIVKPNFVDMEATQYANQITAALTEAGFTGVGDAPLDIISLDEPGVFIAVKNGTNPPPHAMPILSAFQAARIEMRNTTANWVPDENTVVIVVARKP